MARAASARWPLAARVAHWCLALFALAAALYAVYLLNPPAWTDAALARYQAGIGTHKALGLLALAALAALILQHGRRPPRMGAGNARRLATVTQTLFFVVIPTLAVTGYFSTSLFGQPLDLPLLPALASPFRENKPLASVLDRAHVVLGFAFLALAALHVTGALHGQFARKDNTLGRMLGAIFGLVLLAASPASAQPSLAEHAISGVFTRADHGGYRSYTFEVPEGAARIAIAIAYERGEPWTAIDMALYDPERFRGASGFWRTDVVLGAYDASPAYLPGPLPAGQWTLVLGGANAPIERETPFAITIRIEGAPSETTRSPGFRDGAIATGPAWYRGDLHAHTGHSDGTCTAQSGARAPCPLVRTLDAAAARGLDFIAVTEHNTISHFNELRALQPAFDRLTLIPGQEVTTYRGHMNVYGPLAAIDFRLGTEHVPDVATLAAGVAALGGLISINHPGISLTEGCPGCGWSAELGDARIDAVEIVNGVVARWGDGAEGPASSIPFWHGLLNAGRRVTGIGGSDNHDPTESFSGLSSVGAPSNVVYANALSAGDIIDAVRAGHAFIDVEGTRERLLELNARASGADAMMGDTLAAPTGSPIELTVRVRGAAGARLEILYDGAVLDIAADDAALGGDDARAFMLESDGERHWLSVNVRDTAGALLLIGNPIYLNWDQSVAR